MTKSNSFKKALPARSSLLNEDPDFSSDLDDEQLPAGVKSAAASRAPTKSGSASASGAKTIGGARARVTAPAVEVEEDDDDDVGTSFDLSAGYESDGAFSRQLRELMETAAKRTAKADAKIEQEAAAARAAAFDEAEIKIKEVKAKAEQEYTAVVAAAEKKIGASKRRLDEASKAFETDCSQLLADIKSAVKKAKTASAEMDSERASAKEAMDRVLRTHKAESDKIVNALEVQQRDIMTSELNLGGVIREISAVASALEHGGI